MPTPAPIAGRDGLDQEPMTMEEINRLVSAEEGVARFHLHAELTGTPIDHYEVQVYRTSTMSRRQPIVWRTTLPQYDESRVIQECGSGQFVVKLRDQTGKFVTRYDLDIDPVAVKLMQPEKRGAEPEEFDDPRLKALSDQLAELRQNVRVVPGTAHPAQTGLSIGDIAALITALKPTPSEGLKSGDMLKFAGMVLPLIVSKQSPVGELVSAMKDIRNMTEDGLGGGDAPPAWLAPIVGALQAWGNTPAQPRPMPRPAASPAPRAPTAKLAELSPCASALVFGLQNQLDPSLIADNLSALLDRSDETPEWTELVAPDPSVVRPWLESILPAELRELIPAYRDELDAVALVLAENYTEDGDDDGPEDDE